MTKLHEVKNNTQYFIRKYEFQYYSHSFRDYLKRNCTEDRGYWVCYDTQYSYDELIQFIASRIDSKFCEFPYGSLKLSSIHIGRVKELFNNFDITGHNRRLIREYNRNETRTINFERIQQMSLMHKFNKYKALYEKYKLYHNYYVSLAKRLQKLNFVDFKNKKFISKNDRYTLACELFYKHNYGTDVVEHKQYFDYMLFDSDGRILNPVDFLDEAMRRIVAVINIDKYSAREDYYYSCVNRKQEEEPVELKHGDLCTLYRYPSRNGEGGLFRYRQGPVPHTGNIKYRRYATVRRKGLLKLIADTEYGNTIRYKSVESARLDWEDAWRMRGHDGRSWKGNTKFRHQWEHKLHCSKSKKIA